MEVFMKQTRNTDFPVGELAVWKIGVKMPAWFMVPTRTQFGIRGFRCMI